MTDAPPRRRAGRAALALAGLAVATACISLVVHRSGAPRSSTGVQPASVEPSIVNIDGITASGLHVAGTGMVIRADGVVLTNNHVIADTVSLTATMATTQLTFPVHVVGVDPTHDVAVLQLDDAPRLPAAPLDSSQVAALGDHVTALGNALGLDEAPVAAGGTITSLAETLVVSDPDGTDSHALDGMICFDGNIQPGDSGGPLVGASGRVVGMDTAGSKAGSATPTSGCAIPIGRALQIAHDILSGAPSPYIEGPHRGALGIVFDRGATRPEVAGVPPGGGAALAGMQAGDLIVAIDGSPIATVADVSASIKGRRPGDEAVVRWTTPAGQVTERTVTLSSGPPA